MKILVLGDSYCSSDALRPAFSELHGHEVFYADVVDEPDWRPSSASERKLRELLGSPRQVASHLRGHDVLVVQAAPVSDAIVADAPDLKLICVARGGPVNVDLDAASARGIPVVTTPGKNATAVAELTLTMMVMLARRIAAATRHVVAGNELFIDNYEGARWFGEDLAGHTLGLIGFGQIGRRVASRAQAFDMSVIVHDPFVSEGVIRAADAEALGLDALLEAADYVSVHARATSQNRGMMGASEFARMKAGAYFINTARLELVDEDALADALRSGRLAGAALDVANPSPEGSVHPLLGLGNVILLPHIGGATTDTLINGGRIAADEIRRFAEGKPLRNLANADTILVPHPSL